MITNSIHTQIGSSRTQQVSAVLKELPVEDLLIVGHSAMRTQWAKVMPRVPFVSVHEWSAVVSNVIAKIVIVDELHEAQFRHIVDSLRTCQPQVWVVNRDYTKIGEDYKEHPTQMMIVRRRHILVNTDPQRRCYNGCHFSSELRWGPWESLEHVTSSYAEARVKWWRELNDDAVKARGEEARTEFKAISLQEYSEGKYE